MQDISELLGMIMVFETFEENSGEKSEFHHSKLGPSKIMNMQEITLVKKVKDLI